MKSKTLFFILFIIAVLAAVKLLFLKPDNGTQSKGGPQKPSVVTVSGFVVHGVDLENIIFSSGTIIANEEVQLYPEVQGKLTYIGFKEGTRVEKGTLLAKINDAELQAQLKKLQVQLKLATEKEARLKSLLEISGVSQEEYDASANQLQTISADMDYTKALVAKTEIYAPFSGRIGLKQVSEGSFVNSATRIASMQQTAVLKLDFSIPEKYAGTVAVGDSVFFRLSTIDKNFHANVIAIEPKIDAQTRNVLIRATFVNSDDRLFPGAFAQVQLKSSKNHNAFMVPTEAIIPELKGKKVYLCKEGKAVPQKVITGTRTDARIEILEGVAEGDTLIVTGIMSLKPDALVKIVELKK